MEENEGGGGVMVFDRHNDNRSRGNHLQNDLRMKEGVDGPILQNRNTTSSPPLPAYTIFIVKSPNLLDFIGG